MEAAFPQTSPVSRVSQPPFLGVLCIFSSILGQHLLYAPRMVAVTVPLSPDTLRSQSGWVKVNDLETRGSKNTLNGRDWDHVGCALSFLKFSNSWCKFSQYLVPDHPLPCGALLCTVRCLAASLTSTSWMPVAPLRSNNQNYLQTLPMSPWGRGQSHPKLRTNDLESTVVVP